MAGTHYPTGGKSRLDPKIEQYNAAAAQLPWLVLRDLDNEACSGGLVGKLVARRSPLLCLRIVPHALEAWLMGDRQAFADFFRISVAAVPIAPEGVPLPKQMIVDLVRRSRKPDLVKDVVPRRGSKILVGPNYEGVMTEFARQYWDVSRAKEKCPALDRALIRLSELKND